MSNRFFDGIPVVSFDVSVEQMSAADFGEALWTKTGRRVYDSADAFAQDAAEFYAAKTNAADAKVDQFRRQIAARIEP